MGYSTVGCIVTITLSLLTAPLVVQAQQAGKVYRVGILTNNAADPVEARWRHAFRLGLRERGWIEGENLVLKSRWTEGDFARLPALVADLVRSRVDLIVARSSLWVQAAKAATTSIPIVFVAHADPVGTGHVASLARPGGDMFGIRVKRSHSGLTRWWQRAVGAATARAAP